MQPRNPYTVSRAEIRDHVSESLDYTDTFMTGYEWPDRFDWPVPVDGMQVGVTNTAVRDAYDDIESVPQMRIWYFFDLWRLFKFPDYYGFHSFHLRASVQHRMFRGNSASDVLSVIAYASEGL